MVGTYKIVNKNFQNNRLKVVQNMDAVGLTAKTEKKENKKESELCCAKISSIDAHFPARFQSRLSDLNATFSHKPYNWLQKRPFYLQMEKNSHLPNNKELFIDANNRLKYEAFYSSSMKYSVFNIK